MVLVTVEPPPKIVVSRSCWEEINYDQTNLSIARLYGAINCGYIVICMLPHIYWNAHIHKKYCNCIDIISTNRISNLYANSYRQNSTDSHFISYTYYYHYNDAFTLARQTRQSHCHVSSIIQPTTG